MALLLLLDKIYKLFNSPLAIDTPKHRIMHNAAITNASTSQNYPTALLLSASAEKYYASIAGVCICV